MRMMNETKILELHSFKPLLEGISNNMDLAMFCVQYATGCREGELVRMRHEDLFKIDDDRLWVRFRTLKNPLHPLRSFPISRKLPWLCNPILEWWENMATNIEPKDWLFPSPTHEGKHISTSYIRKKTVEYFNMRNHSFRHSRVTFYFRKEGNTQKAVRLFGWSDPRPSTDYTHLTTKDLEGTEEI